MLHTILIIEDEEGIRKYLKESLLSNRYSVRDTGKGLKGIEIAEKIQPDVVILDLKLPDISGEEVCKQIKKNMPETIVIMLTAKDTSADIVKGLNIGADDYITKPFTTEEVLARLKARLREDNAGSSKLKVADLVLNQKNFEVTRDGEKVELTPQEFKLLEYLMANKNTVLTREMILNKIWQYSPDVESRVVDVYIGYLRNKIDKGRDKKLIQSVRGFGYVIKEEEKKDKSKKK